MRKLNYRKRNRRIQEQSQDAWESVTRSAQDPGLREIYDSVPRAPVQLVCCALGKAVNHGGLLRLAEAYRLEKVVYEVEPDHIKEFSGVRGSHKWQPWAWGNPLETITAAKAAGHTVYGLTLTEDAVALRDVPWTFPATIVLGRELEGLPPEVEAACDHRVAIPLYGISVSLNVGMAAAIALDQALHQYQTQNPDFQPVRATSQNLLR